MNTLRPRIIPSLLLRGESLVKTVRFGKFRYVGDPANTCRIFNELEVDELVFLDILASREKREPNYALLRDISPECFMPLSYGGGITSVEIAEKVLKIGFEKVIVNTAALRNPALIAELGKKIGSQSLIVAIDVRKGWLGQERCRGLSSRWNSGLQPVTWAQKAQSEGAGEILLTSVDREGTWRGFDLELVTKVVDAVSIPVIARGGAGSMEDVSEVIKIAGASATALGSMVVFQKKDMGVLVNFPETEQLRKALA
ncbi:MAG: imidazole glycerol phosphate synthase subunit HisF [Opitutae bacterium]|nr:imidazole glycerol phosphate synthase subunit HisF [Opitutae bacterium]